MSDFNLLRGLGWLIIAVYATGAVLGVLSYLGFVTLVIAWISRWLKVPFRPQRALIGGMTFCLAGAFLGMVVAHFSWGPTHYREQILWRFVSIGVALGAWLGAAWAGAPGLMGKIDRRRAKLVVILIGALIMTIVVQ